MRGALQPFSVAIRRMRTRISQSVRGRPRFLDFSFQKYLKPCRCQRVTVSGFTTMSALVQLLQKRRKVTQNRRSLLLKLGRGRFCLSTASCRRNAAFSIASSNRGRSKARIP